MNIRYTSLGLIQQITNERLHSSWFRVKDEFQHFWIISLGSQQNGQWFDILWLSMTQFVKTSTSIYNLVSTPDWAMQWPALQEPSVVEKKLGSIQRPYRAKEGVVSSSRYWLWEHGGTRGQRIRLGSLGEMHRHLVSHWLGPLFSRDSLGRTRWWGLLSRHNATGGITNHHTLTSIGCDGWIKQSEAASLPYGHSAHRTKHTVITHSITRVSSKAFKRQTHTGENPMAVCPA